jgi:hypothetical protein
MEPKPTSKAQEAIVNRIDAKARAIAEGLGRWNPQEILAEMKFAVPYEGTTRDDEFAAAYAKWRSENPIVEWSKPEH